MAERKANQHLRLVESKIEGLGRRPLKSGGGDGTFDDMEARVSRLEDDFREVKSDLKAIRLDLSEVKGKLSNMPSTWQMIGIFATLVALLLAGSGILFGVLRYAGF